MRRRERRRRNIAEEQGYQLPLPHFALIESADLFNPAAGLTKHTADPVLVTHDRYLIYGMRHSAAPLSLCRIYDTLADAFANVKHTAPVSLIVDPEGLAQPLLTTLDLIRQQQKYTPGLVVTLLLSTSQQDVQHFVKSACRCIIFRRHAVIDAIRQTPTASDTPTARGDFNAREWGILLQLAQGRTLREIAREQQRPYHRIIYRLSCILTRLKYNQRQQLLRLLQQVNNHACENTPY
ncbi:hypothetical protein [Pluralibacter sp.]|uniref:hypothetical protein n=1 Tax=Pluralibacter sp. TaxID=1920032 RepID=UPI0025E71F84|nr:hypothetical protein [Pluralibacter sp.]MBV8042066.1 response regulator transcription factor [Pluralibacter sp.]